MNELLPHFIKPLLFLYPRLKFWWDEALDELKKASMLSHKLWVDAGKPRNGTIFQKRTRDKLAYRALIKERKESEKSSISNELHDLLLNKIPILFGILGNIKFALRAMCYLALTAVMMTRLIVKNLKTTLLQSALLIQRSMTRK